MYDISGFPLVIPPMRCTKKVRPLLNNSTLSKFSKLLLLSKSFYLSFVIGNGAGRRRNDAGFGFGSSGVSRKCPENAAPDLSI
ncbi:hypothetical protein [Bradyrhizobium sp.]|uniref:hypothetical protein n=1 Tax=Bradyrhizobium sp. TaxID=376 RepID=UPI003C6F54A5